MMALDDENSGDRRPRICVLAAHFVNHSGMSLSGGAEKYLLGTIAGLLDTGAHVQVGYCGDDVYDELRVRWSPELLSIERLDWLNERLAGDRRVTRALVRERRRWFEARRVDAAFFVQQAHGTAFGAGLIGARLAGSRVVMSVRQPPLAFPAATEKRYLGVVPSLEVWRRQQRWRSQRVARSSDVIIFNCESVRRAFVEQWGWPKARCVVVSNGVEHRPAQRMRVGGIVSFGCVGQIAAHKGADVVVEAVRKLSDAGELLEVAFFGDGALTAQLKSASRGLAVRFHSYDRDVERIYPQIDVLIAASRRESSSNAVLEAMSRAIPCIVSDAGGLPELVRMGAAGLVVTAGDPCALADAMRRMRGDAALRSSLGLAGQRAARETHDAKSRLRDTLALIVGARAPRRVRSRGLPEPVGA